MTVSSLITFIAYSLLLGSETDTVHLIRYHLILVICVGIIIPEFCNFTHVNALLQVEDHYYAPHLPSS